MDYDTHEMHTFVPHHPKLSNISADAMVRLLVGYDKLAAFNSDFDKAVVDRFMTGFCLSKWYDVAAVCRINSLPGSLKDACIATDTPAKKDARGNALIKKLCTPPYVEDIGLLAELIDYCEADVRATAALLDVTRELTPTEERDCFITSVINDYGFRVDRDVISLAQREADRRKAALADELYRLTGGHIAAPTQTARIKAYLHDLYLDNSYWLAATDRGKRFDKAARREILAAPTDSFLRRIVEIVDAGNMSSLAKFDRMLAMSDDETHRVRGALVHAGAGRTLRYSSRGVQIHNLRRDAYTPDETEKVLETWSAGQALTDPDMLPKLLRPAIIPHRDGVFVIGDWSAIEARVLPWLAGADDVLDVFRRGDDIYQTTADAMGVDRQIGKVAVLALGFGGTVGAFRNMASLFGLEIHDVAAMGYVEAWRAANPWAPKFWAAVEAAVSKAMGTPNVDIQVGRVTYCYKPSLLGGTMLCGLPDGSLLQYPYFKAEAGRYGVEYSTLKPSVKPRVGEPWPRDRLWFGTLVENITQATAAALLRDLLRRLYANPGPFHIAFHVHDEVVLEAHDGAAVRIEELLKHEMETPPSWAERLPLKADPIVATRYGKG
jgi:DNA polymerase